MSKLLPLVLLLAFVAGCGSSDDAEEGGSGSGEAPNEPTAVVGAGEIVKTESGLRYAILEPGEPGTRPQPGDIVTVHYTGTFEDGRVFDSSVTKGRPFTFTLGQGKVIPGWDEGVALMDVGSKVKLYVPWDLAYGAEGRPPRIPPKTNLDFEVELLEVARVPIFQAPDADAQTCTDSGLCYEVIQPSDRAHPRPDQGVLLRYAVWNPDGDLIVSNVQTKQLIAGVVSDLKLGNVDVPFLAEAAQLMAPGSRLRFEVPAPLAFGDAPVHPKLTSDSTTIWEIELVSVHDVPSFESPNAENQTRTNSGLAYEVLRAAEGPTPGATDTVSVHYTGWLPDGTLFDSSHARGEPISFPLNRVIAGWSEGVQLMPVGSSYRFEIPGDLAYGASPPPGSGIPANSTLVFLVELLAIE